MNILLYVRSNEKGIGRFQCIINSIAGAVNIFFTKRNPTYSYFIYVYSRNYNRETLLLSIGNRLFQSLGRINKIHGYHPGAEGPQCCLSYEAVLFFTCRKPAGSLFCKQKRYGMDSVPDRTHNSAHIFLPLFAFFFFYISIRPFVYDRSAFWANIYFCGI